jgi:ABC-type polysaccharide/polyol phosphate export permease
MLLGMAVWGFLRESAVSGCRALIANEAYIRQSALPYGLYPLRTVLGQAIHSLIALAVSFALVVAMAAAYGRPAPNPLCLLWVTPGLVLAFVTAWAVATVFAFVNVYFHDTQHLLEVATQIVFFTSPIIHDGQGLKANGFGVLLTLNPVVLFLDLIRGPVLSGNPPSVDLLLAGAAVTAAAVGLAAGTTAWLQKRVIFHL